MGVIRYTASLRYELSPNLAEFDCSTRYVAHFGKLLFRDSPFDPDWPSARAFLLAFGAISSSIRGESDLATRSTI